MEYHVILTVKNHTLALDLVKMYEDGVLLFGCLIKSLKTESMLPKPEPIKDKTLN